MKHIEIIDGPNLNLTGIREPETYGTTRIADYVEQLRNRFADIEIGYFQSNIEGELIDRIQQVGFEADGIIINAGGYSHTSVALHDALAAVTAPAIEVHISNIFAREDYRHHSLLSSACRGIICGMGLEGYALAIEALLRQ
ncbi:MAG: type II 3-dehydroquinate dehydratase [Bacteroidales bacterium]|nr:type II 3-dehydroquinate dehydratase [Bacteroidales bacterium]MBR6330875.1 type II 3-dehydroquinate dehydratase [Bacteroidales bacterium]